MNRRHRDQLLEIVEKALGSASAVECLDIEFVSDPDYGADDRTVRVILDRPAGVVDIDDCVAVTRLLEGVPEFEGALPDNCHLEVCSPGTSRPLRRERHFARHIGDRLEVRLSGDSAAAGGAEAFEGQIVSVQDGVVSLRSTEAAEASFNVCDVDSAHLVDRETPHPQQ